MQAWTAIHNAIDLYVELSESPVSPEELAWFKEKFSTLITESQNFKVLRSFIILSSSYAERGRLDGFKDACWTRSMIQIIDDEFLDWSKAGSPTQRSLFIEDVEDIDETIEDVSDEAPPVLEHEMPDWVPESHWWWRAPKNQDMSESERRSRLEYDHWDGVYD